MARWTQYIGLSKEALTFLSENKAKDIGSYVMTQGICFEDVRGKIYEIECLDEMSPTSWKETYVEIEDVTPWSSGPMIHTALRNIRTGEVMFKWKDEEIHQY